MNWILAYLVIGVVFLTIGGVSGLINDYYKSKGLAFSIGVCIQLIFIWPLTLFDGVCALAHKIKSRGN